MLVLGDSLSAAFGINNEQSWVRLLQARLVQNGFPHRVVNASVSGATTADGIIRLPSALREHKPEIVILELGGNDGLRALDSGMIRDNLGAMIRMSRESGARVLVAGLQMPPNYGPDYTARFAAVYTQLAKDTGAALIPFFLDRVATNAELMQDDGVHPNAAGQPLILDTVWRYLLPLLQATRE